MDSLARSRMRDEEKKKEARRKGSCGQRMQSGINGFGHCAFASDDKVLLGLEPKEADTAQRKGLWG